MNGREKCAACGKPRDLGALLLVVDRRAQRTTETICRYSVEGRCFAWCGSATQTAIAELDPVAAREFDRAAMNSEDAGARERRESFPRPATVPAFLAESETT